METTWEIANLKRKSDTGLVVNVTWIAKFKLGAEEDRKIGKMELQGSEEDLGFIPFENLTEEIVIQWVKDQLGESMISEMESQYQNVLEERINKKTNPEFLVGTPWDKNPNKGFPRIEK